MADVFQKNKSDSRFLDWPHILNGLQTSIYGASQGKAKIAWYIDRHGI